MLCSRQEIHSLTRKYFLSAYCVPGPVVGAGHGGGGGRSGLVPGGCVGPGLRARREAVCSGRIQVPGCSRRGGDGQGGAGSCPVWSSIGMEAGAVGVGHVVGCLWGRGRIWPGGVGGGSRHLESLSFPDPSGLTSIAAGGLRGAGRWGPGPCLSVCCLGTSDPQVRWFGWASGSPASHSCSGSLLTPQVQPLSQSDLRPSSFSPGGLCPLLPPSIQESAGEGRSY